MSIDKLKRLQEKAMFLRLLLENYAKNDDWKNRDIGDLLQHMLPLFEKIMRGELMPPAYGEYNRRDFSDEYHSYILKYPALRSAAASFASVLEDWNNPFPEFEQDRAKWLQERVLPFRGLLEYYAKTDDAAKQLLAAMEPLLDEINKCQVMPPIVNEYRWWFTNRESPLFNKYPDLTEAASNYDGDVEDGWFITGKGKAFGRESP